MEGKKISFGFIKTKKVEKLPPPVQEKKDFIECVEEKSIKVVGGDTIKEEAPLVIPMKPNTLITAERLKEIAEKVESGLVEPEIIEQSSNSPEKPENETLEQMAVRELLEDSKKLSTVETAQLTLALPAKSEAGGQKESTLDDYESVPVQEFGLAMLRGMGWTSTNQKSAYKQPPLRPKGLGLGADKVVKDNQKHKAVKNSREEELCIVKNAFVQITTGKYSGYYGKVVSLDEDNGRVVVDITVKKETVSLSEFMMHPVTKSEFDKESKVINASSFEEYKKNEGQISKNPEKESTRSEQNNGESSKGKRSEQSKSVSKTSSKYNHSRENERRDRDKQSEDRKEGNRDKSNREKNRDSRKEYRNQYKRDSSLESLVDSDSETKNRKEDKSKNKKQYSSMESLDSDTENRSKERRSRDNKPGCKLDKERKRLDSDSEADRPEKSKERKRHDSDTQSHHKRKKSKQRKRRDSHSDSKIKHRRDDRQRHDSNSESDHGKLKRDNKRKESDSESDKRKRSDTPEGKRDIDKKRKGKKKKRDRDRSPHHRKHKK